MYDIHVTDSCNDTLSMNDVYEASERCEVVLPVVEVCGPTYEIIDDSNSVYTYCM